MKLLKQRLSRALHTTNGERAICQFIKERPELILWCCVATGGHSKYVVSEFPFGSNYRADFVVPFSYSGVWEVHFIELEPPSDAVFTKSGRPTKRLSSAIAQIGDWRQFIERNQALVRKDLSDWCTRRDLLGWHTQGKAPFNHTGDYLKDPETFIKFEYHIVIGRRRNVTQEVRRRMNQFRSTAL